MSLKNTLAILSLITTLLVSGSVLGQTDIPSPRFRHLDVESPESTRPLAEPGVFHYDAQMFAPLEFTNHEQLEPSTGFFFTYDRIYTNVGRPGRADTELGNFPVGNDYIWGNVFNLGWMTEDDSGWGLRYQKADGSFYAHGRDVLIAQPMQVTTNFSTFEVNRIFRQSLKNGGYFEPYMGVKYIGLSDKTIEDTAQGAGPNRFKQEATNSSVGFNFGGRYSRRAGRFRTTLDGSILAGYNQQRYFATDIVVVAGGNAVSEFYADDEAFTPSMDLKFEVAYNFSRDLAVRMGVQSNYIWDGIVRANTLTTNLNPNSNFGGGGLAAGSAGIIDSNMWATGFTFGIEWKR